MTAPSRIAARVFGAFASVAVLALGLAEAAEPIVPTAASIIGSWRGQDEDGRIGELVFNADGTADMTLDGKSVQRDLIRGRGEFRYRFDPTPRPAHLDLIARTLDGSEQAMLAIVEFPRPDHMRVSVPVVGARPTSFSPKDSIVVVRVSSLSQPAAAAATPTRAPREAPAPSSPLIPFTLPPPPQARRAPSVEDVRAYFPVLQGEGEAMAAMRPRTAQVRGQLDLMDEAPFTPLLKRLLAEVSTYADPGRPVAQRQGVDEKLASKQVKAAYDALAVYAAQINPELERMSNQLEYVRLRLRTQVKSQRLQRLAGGSGRKWPLSDSIALLEHGIARSEIDSQNFTLASTAELERLMQLYDTAYEDVQRGMLSEAMKQPIDSIPEHRRDPACPAPPPSAASRPAKADATNTAPRIDVRRSKPTSDFYPPESRRAFSEGVVTLRAFIDSEGCVERVQVLGLTGDARLDMAAVRWVLDGATFTPGMHDGARTPMATVFRVRFALRE